jgi:hypothetical protein
LSITERSPAKHVASSILLKGANLDASQSQQLPKAGITVVSAADCYERERVPRRERPFSDWLPFFVAFGSWFHWLWRVDFHASCTRGCSQLLERLFSFEIKTIFITLILGTRVQSCCYLYTRLGFPEELLQVQNIIQTSTNYHLPSVWRGNPHPGLTICTNDLGVLSPFMCDVCYLQIPPLKSTLIATSSLPSRWITTVIPLILISLTSLAPDFVVPFIADKLCF